MHDAAFIHQYVVDAWAAQRANDGTKPITLTFALVGLCLRARGFSGKEVQRVHMLLALRKESWSSFPLPKERGELTPVQVLQSPAGPKRDEAIGAWCACVWEAYRGSHEAVADFLRRHGIG